MGWLVQAPGQCNTTWRVLFGREKKTFSEREIVWYRRNYQLFRLCLDKMLLTNLDIIACVFDHCLASNVSSQSQLDTILSSGHQWSHQRDILGCFSSVVQITHLSGIKYQTSDLSRFLVAFISILCLSASTVFVISAVEQILSLKPAGKAAIKGSEKETGSLRGPARWLMVNIIL